MQQDKTILHVALAVIFIIELYISIMIEHNRYFYYHFEGPGTYSAGGTNTCQSCEAGRYNSVGGQSYCGDCGSGYYCTGGSARAACGAGTHSFSANAANEPQCKVCLQSDSYFKLTDTITN